MSDSAQVERHYARGRILEAILDALSRSGKDLEALEPRDLAAVDEFHVRGREATIELAGRGSLAAGLRVLDVGCGLGGSARYLADEHGCDVTGIDLTQEYVDTATELARRVGLGGRVRFRRASATALPFADASFDAAWTEHVQMNIADKHRFYGEIARVLVPGGELLFHDLFAGPGGEVRFPVPWAEDPSISFLVSPDEARSVLAEVGLGIVDWKDATAEAVVWFDAIVERMKTAGPPPLGIHLLMGETARSKIANILLNLRERRVLACQAVARRT